MAFLNYEKAYDRADREGLCKVLKDECYNVCFGRR